MGIRFLARLASSFVLMLTAACTHQEPFDAAKWQDKQVDWWGTDFREVMLDDLLESQILPGKSKEEVIQLLGEPERRLSADQVQYVVREKYGWDIDPEYLKYLLVTFDLTGHAQTAIVQIDR